LVIVAGRKMYCEMHRLEHVRTTNREQARKNAGVYKEVKHTPEPKTNTWSGLPKNKIRREAGMGWLNRFNADLDRAAFEGFTNYKDFQRAEMMDNGKLWRPRDVPPPVRTSSMCEHLYEEVDRALSAEGLAIITVRCIYCTQEQRILKRGALNGDST